METIRFEDLKLSSEILKAVENKGFEEATPIQAQSIPYIMEGRDIIGQAQTGTGKTAAFGIPILEKLSHEEKAIQAMVICPTRELAIQVAEEIRELAKYKRGVDILPIYGGQPIDRQIKALKKRPQIIVGTPGRVMDHMNRGTLKIDKVRTVVLDEADEMLDMGFIDDIVTILKAVPEGRQTLLFSATMPRPILELTKRFQKNPKHIMVVHKELTAPKIEQVYYEVKEKTKAEVLSRLIDMYNPKLSLVFCNTKRKVDDLVAELQGRGYFADGLHGDLKQVQRDRVMSKFRNGSVDVLVATDVAARGIDVENIEAVFNYDLPQDEEYYVHRIGRTARAGRGGRAFTFVVGREIYKLRDIQRYAKAKIALKKAPSSEDVEEVRTNIFLEKVKEIINENNLSQYVNTIERLAGEDYTSIEIAAALLKMSIGNKEKEVQHEEADYENTGAEAGMVRLFINIGRSQNIRPGDIVGGIAGETGIPGKLIGSIDIYDKYTFVEVPREYANDVIKVMKDNQIKGKRINIEPANAKH
jgi:ATP-dependent RNA helicase DeaD